MSAPVHLAAASAVAVVGEGRRLAAVTALFRRYGLALAAVAPGRPIPGSYWGEAEAGLVGHTLHLRPDTPVHSLLHEGAHYVCMDPERREAVDTDAGGDVLEECAVCYLSILLADVLPGYGRARMLADMDAWGYTFRLGSARAWFEGDATDARDWLLARGLLDAGAGDRPAFRLRGVREGAPGPRDCTSRA